jgi:ketosteroid isomerase-like protein
MALRNPKDYHSAFVEAFNRQDINGILALYESDAVLVPGAGPVRGRAEMHTALSQLLALKGTMRLETVYLLEAGDLALSRGKWTLDGTDPSGKPVHMESSSIEVLRKQPDGNWLVVIDHPFGAAS